MTDDRGAALDAPGAIILTDANWRALDTERGDAGRLSKSIRAGLHHVAGSREPDPQSMLGA